MNDAQEVAQPTPEQMESAEYWRDRFRSVNAAYLTRTEEYMAAYEEGIELRRQLSKLLAVAEAARRVVEAGGGVHMTERRDLALFHCESCGWFWDEGKSQEHATDCPYNAMQAALAALEGDKQGEGGG